MRLYCKLALLVLAACAVQVCLSTSFGRDTYFALRCYVANATGNRAMESQLIIECERSLAMEKHRAEPIALAYDVVASR
jgi:hypothetical protein